MAAQPAPRGSAQSPTHVPVAGKALRVSASLFLSLRDGVSVAATDEGELTLTGATDRMQFKRLGNGAAAALERLAATGASEDELCERVRAADGVAALANFRYYLQRLAKRGLLLRSVYADDALMATAAPVMPEAVFVGHDLSLERRYVLSRFAYLRREGTDAVLECPTSDFAVVVHDPRTAVLLYNLATPRRVAELAPRIAGLSHPGAAAVTSLLLGSGMLADPDDPNRDGASPALRSWEFHDLLFHARSRLGPVDSRIGGTYPRTLGPTPALKPMEPTETLGLYRPDLDRLQRDDPPFARVQEARRSIREYADEPITAHQLGEFLFRVARATRCTETTVDTPHGQVPLNVAARPYPSGGALYELELYAVINACRGLPPGLHYYDPLGHRLCQLKGRAADVQQLLTEAATSAQTPGDRLQVLLIISARFGRIGWKYGGLAYSLILKNVGVLFQTMYLAATAMGLAPCALGAGDARLFTCAASTDPHAEASVGEFLLGSRR